MAKALPVDYQGIIVPELEKFSSRTDDIAIDDKRLKMSLEMQSLEWHTAMSKIKREILLFKSQVREMNEKITRMKAQFVDVVMDFRTKINDEDFDKLNKKLKRFSFEDFVTKDEFKRILRKSGL